MIRKDRGFNKLKKRSLITYYDPRSSISEQYRTVRTNIQFTQIDDRFNTILITSAKKSEGKSTTVANLAVVMAQQGKRVLIIDADLRKPIIHHIFSKPNTRGLTSVLSNQFSFQETVLPTQVENLSVLPSGPIPPNPSEILGSKMMDQLVEEAKENYDCVLFDCPPVLGLADAQVIANHCQGAILVIHSGKTEIEAVIKAKESLFSTKVKLLGTILNRKKMKRNEYYYYY